jgi:hypothetical protein
LALVDVLILAAPEDAELCRELEKHLSVLRRGRHLDFGRTLLLEEDAAAWAWIDIARVFVVLVSPDLLARIAEGRTGAALEALDRHHSGEVRVLPVLLRPCDISASPLGVLRATPRSGVPITRWEDRHEAWVEVTRDIRAVLESLSQAPGGENSREHVVRRAGRPRLLRLLQTFGGFHDRFAELSLGPGEDDGEPSDQGLEPREIKSAEPLESPPGEASRGLELAPAEPPPLHLNAWFPDQPGDAVALTVDVPANLCVQLGPPRGAGASEPLPGAVVHGLHEVQAIDVLVLCPGADLAPISQRLRMPPDPARVLNFTITARRAGRLELEIVLLVHNEPIHRMPFPVDALAAEGARAAGPPGQA